MQSEQNTKRWFDHIEAWQQSGINQSEYCRRHKLCIKSFSSWKLKRNSKDVESLLPWNVRFAENENLRIAA